MRTRVIYSPLVPRHILAIVLMGFIFTNQHRLSPDMVRHEMIHVRQQKELLYLPFFLIYLIEWLIKLIIYRNWDRAYRNISFEREAYTNQYRADYLTVRKHYAFLRYIHIP